MSVAYNEGFDSDDSTSAAATITSDLDKGTTAGDADGPAVWRDELGKYVPTFINERLDLVTQYHGREKAFQRLSHHVPFKLRGTFTAEDWPEKYRNSLTEGVDYRVDDAGFVLCQGVNRGEARRNGGKRCKSRAVNRSMFCGAHGGTLHPADRKISAMSVAPLPPDRVQNLDRVQKFMQGFIQTEELDDDEVQGGFVRNSQGIPIVGWRLGAKFQAQLTKELHRRLNEFLKTKTPDMLKVMVDIAENDLFEAADRIKAAQWVAERTMGKTPDVLVTATTDAPYQSILAGIESGSRETYRQAVGSYRDDDGERSSRELAILDVEVDSDVAESRSDDGEAGEDESEFLDRSDDGSDRSVRGRADRIDDERTRRLERAKAIRKAKARRFAARAVGATSLSEQPWLVEFVYTQAGGRSRPTWKMKLWPPDQQTPTIVDRIMKSYDELRRERSGVWRRTTRLAPPPVGYVRR